VTQPSSNLKCDILISKFVFFKFNLYRYDVVAKLAQELGPDSLILSADRDMFRYVGLDNPAERVMADFTFEPIAAAATTSTTISTTTAAPTTRDGVGAGDGATGDGGGDGGGGGGGYSLRLIRSHNPTMRRGVTKRWLSDVPYHPEVGPLYKLNPPYP
jgi:hypothetical protein